MLSFSLAKEVPRYSSTVSVSIVHYVLKNIIRILAPSDAPLNILFTVQGSRARDWISQDFHLLSDMLEPDRSPLARGHGSVRLPSLSLHLHPKTCLSPPERAGRINSEDNKHFRSTWFCPPIFIPSRVIALGHCS